MNTKIERNSEKEEKIRNLKNQKLRKENKQMNR